MYTLKVILYICTMSAFHTSGILFCNMAISM